MLSIQTFVPESGLGTINGLLGHFDGNSTNDLTNRDGNVVCVIGAADCTIQKIHTQFGETCELACL